MTSMTNVFKFFEILKDSGQFSEGQANTLAKAMESAQADVELVTSADLRASVAEMKAHVESTKISIILWNIVTIMSVSGAMFAMFAKALHWY